jgi:hypothetical protein
MDLRSWRNKWNDAELPQIPNFPGESSSRPWPLFGMLALGLVAGAALGGYAVSQRTQMKRLAAAAHRMGDELADMGSYEAAKPAPVVTTHRSNHGRKAASEV